MQQKPKADKVSYPPLDHYRDFIRWYGAFAPYVAMHLCVPDCGIQQIITRNFVSRATIALRGLIALWDIQDYQDCWGVNRVLLDRLFHLHYLNRTNSFAAFDDWSFLLQFHGRNAIRSSPLFKGKISKEFFRDSDADKARAKTLLNNPPVWARPDAAAEAKAMNLEFLYKQGYDYASTLVHPMANDGQQDYTTITGQNLCSWPDQTVVIHNSCLAALLILREAMRGSTHRWHRLVLECMDEALHSLEDGSKKYLRVFVELGRAVPDGNWSGAGR